MLEKMVFKSMKKRIDPYLEPGEELLSVTTPLEALGSMHGYLFGGEIGFQIKAASRDRAQAAAQPGTETAGGVKVATANMTLAITSRRLLLFKFGHGTSPKPEFLLTSIPIREVESIIVGDSSGMTRPVTLNIHGQSYDLEVRRAVDTTTLISAFAQVKSGTPGIALGGGLEGTSGSLPPADWYADPQHVARLRYWDGGQWTDNTAP
jgi:hypothetical protein